jgi:hypothetical protein
MSDLRTPDQILTDVGINVENFKKDKELLYRCIRRAMDDFAEQYHNWKQGKANGDNAIDSGLHLQRVSGMLPAKISHECPNGNLFVSLDGADIVQIIDIHKNINSRKVAELVVTALSNYR